MGINHGGIHVLVTGEFLDSPYVIAVFAEVCCTTVPQGMNGCLFRDAGFDYCFLECPL